jgi:hypothetical protein
MTYVRDLQVVAGLKPAVINCSTPSSSAVGGVFSLSGSPTPNSSISSNQLILSAGYHFYLEASILVRNASLDGAVTWGFHDQTSYVGQEGFMNLATSLGADARISRRVARALIINSGSDQTIDVRIKSLSGTNWTFAITATGISTFSYVGYPSLRIWEVQA